MHQGSSVGSKAGKGSSDDELEMEGNVKEIVR